MAATEETRLARKRQNRQAQVIYRERKRAAENAQKNRINRLENVVEQMSSVFMDFADELMAHEDLKRNRNVVDCLRRTIEAMVNLGAQVVESEELGTWNSAPEKHEGTTPQTEFEKPRAQQKDLPPVVNVYSQANELPRTEPRTVSSDPLFASLEPLSELPLISASPFQFPQMRNPSPAMPKSFFGNGWLPYHGDFVDMTPPFEGVYVSPDSFSFRLVERTLATTYNMLFRDERILGEHTQSIFKYTLRSKERQAILAHVRWMLGPGRHRLFRAVDIPAARVAELLGKGHDGLIETDGEGTFSSWSNAQLLIQGPMPPSMLSAIDVQRKLEQLGARHLDGDVLELRLPGSNGSINSMAPDAEAYRNESMAEAMTIRLSVPLLMYNLSMTAVCLEVGPGFRSEGLYGAVEASVIPIPVESGKF